MVLNTFERIRALPLAYQTVMALYLCQRMVPNYELFHHVTGFGDPKPLQGALSACWDWAWQGKAVKVNFSRWQEKVDEVTPSEHGHDMLGVYPAMDACTAISTLLQGLMDQNSADLVSVAKVSQASVAKFLELTEGAEMDAAVALPLGHEQQGDQVAGDDEEHLDPEETARQPARIGVVDHDRDDRDRAEAVEPRQVGHAADRHPAGTHGAAQLRHGPSVSPRGGRIGRQCRK